MSARRWRVGMSMAATAAVNMAPSCRPLAEGAGSRGVGGCADMGGGARPEGRMRGRRGLGVIVMEVGGYGLCRGDGVVG